MGKKTTTRHKNDNTFRFQGQKERQQKIVINRLGSIRDWLRDEDEDDSMSFLAKAMEHWKDLNLYIEFSDVLNEIGSDVKSLPQVIHQKERINGVLLSRIEVTSKGYLEPLYGLLTAFVMDIQNEFAEYLPGVLQKITDVVLSTTDADVIALSLDCYSRLLKDMKTTVMKNFNVYFKLFVQLLSSRVKNYVMENAVKSMSFVVSKVAKANTGLFYKKIQRAISHRDNLENGFTLLLFEMMTSQLIVKDSLAIAEIIQFIDEAGDDSAKWESLVLSLLKMLIKNKNQSKERNMSLWKAVETALTPELFQRQFQFCARVLNVMYENQTLGEDQITDIVARMNSFLVKSKSLWEQDASRRAEVVTILCTSLRFNAFDRVTKPLLESAVPCLNFEQLQSIDSVFQTKYAQYTRIMSVFGNAYRSVRKEEGGANHSLFSWYSDLIVSNEGGIKIPNRASHSVKRFHGLSLPCYYFKSEPRRKVTVNFDAGLTDIRKSQGTEFMEAAIADPEQLLTNEEKYLRFLVVLQQVNLKEHPDVLTSLVSLFNSILSKNTEEDIRYSSFLYLIFECISLSECLGSLKGDHVQNFVPALASTLVISDVDPDTKFSIWNLKLLDTTLYSLRSQKQVELLEYFAIQPEDLILKLEDNLISGFKVIRTLTLSILLQLHELRESPPEDLIKYLDLAMDNELKELDVVNVEHMDNYMGMEVCVKGMSSEVADSAPKFVGIMKYMLGTLFHNHGKLLQTNRDTLCPILLEKLSAAAFWEIVGSRFVKLHSEAFTEPKSFLRGTDACSEFWKKLTTFAFGFENSEFTELGLEVKMDYGRYKVNLWKLVNISGLKLPTQAQIQVLECVHQLYKQVLSPPPYVGLREDPAAKEITKILLQSMEFLSLYPGKKIPGTDHRREICLGVLAGNKAGNKLSLSVLRKLSPTINTFLAKIEKLGEDNWEKSVHLKSFQGPDAFIVPQDRNIFMEFIVRSILTLKYEMKNDCMNYIISFLHGFQEEEVLQQIKYLFGGIEAWSGVNPTLGLLKYLKGHLLVINRMVSEWRYAFPNVVTYLMELVCLFVEISSRQEDGDEASTPATITTTTDTPSSNSDGENHAIHQRKKAILSSARSIIVNFFNLFEKLPISEELIERIFKAVICVEKADTTIYSSDSISWYFQLMNTWSKIPRYHILFIKCTDQDPASTIIHNLFDAFDSKFLKLTPYLYLMEIITSLGFVESEEDKELEEFEEPKPEVPPLTCGETLHLMESDESLGEKILRLNKDRLLQVISKTNFLKEKMFVGSRAETFMDFLRLCTKFSTEPETNHKLCSTIISFLRRFHNKPAELLGLYELVEELMKRSTPNNAIAVQLSHCLCWTKEKGPRVALCRAIADSMVNKNQAVLISNLNSYTTKVGDSLDFETIQNTFQKLTDLIKESKKFKLTFYTLIADTCFYYISNESDIGILSAAEGMLETLSESLSYADQESQEQVRKFLDTVVIPRLKWGVKNKSDDVFHLHLKVLSIYSRNGHEFHGTLKGTHAIFQNEDKDLLIDLQEMQLSARTKAINQFQNLWPIMRKQPSTVVDFVIPILSHHLMEKTKLKSSYQNLLQCSLEAIKWCCVALPHASLFKYLENMMEALPEDDQLLKQYHKLLGFILDGYHYELDEKLVKELEASQRRPFQKDVGELAGTVEDIPLVEEMDVVQGGEGTEGEGGDNSSSPAEPKEEETPQAEPENELIVKLNYDQSKSLIKTIQLKFIPRLRKYLHLEEKASHKLARVESGGDTLIKKIPTTLAYVKLLNKLPKSIRKSHAVWVIPTLCCSLNSRLISVRSNVRNTLLKIVEELGPDIFPDIVKACKAYLVRGFQKHVRNFTLLHILKNLQEAFALKPECVPVYSLIPIVEDEMFSFMSEDKDVKEILKNTPEAKAQNGLQLLYFCAKFVKAESLGELLKCPIERAKSAKTLDTLKTIKAWMTEVSNGLPANQNLSTRDILVFLSLQLNTTGKLQVTPKEAKVDTTPGIKYLEAQSDSLLLPGKKFQAPKQGTVGVVSAVSWFVYSCLHNILKRDQVDDESKETLLLLDQFARDIVNAENDESLEIRTPMVRSLILMYQFPLKSFMNAEFVKKMWRKYFMAVNNEVSNESINMYYKFLTSFCVTFSEFRLESNDFSLLIKCIIRHLQENKCTGSALVLVRNILHRSLISKDLKTLIRELKRRICANDSIHVQEGCRAAYVVYVKNYLKTQEEFQSELYDFFKVLGYRTSLQDIHSVYRMIGALITLIPESWLATMGTTLGMDLILALMKSSDEESQKIICNSCMRNLFEKMASQQGQELVKELKTTAELPEMIPYQREICLSISKIVEHSKCWDSEAVVLDLLEILSQVLTPSTLLELQTKCKNVQGRHRDFGIFEAVIASKRLLELCISNSTESGKVAQKLRQIMEWIRKEYFTHSHESIQDASVQFLNFQLSLLVQLQNKEGKLPKVLEILSDIKSSEGLLELTKEYVKMGGNMDLEDMKGNVLTGLNFLANLVCQLQEIAFHVKLMKDLRYNVNVEVRRSNQETHKRETVFAFCSQYVDRVPEDCLEAVQQNLMNITTREVTDKNMQNVSSKIVDLCTSIQKKLEERVGRQVFLQLYEKARSSLQDKRDENRAKKKEQVVLSMDPLSVIPFRKRKRVNKKPMQNGKKKKFSR